MNWTLKYNNKELPLATWGLSQLKRLRINQGTDKVEFTQIGAALETAPIFEPEASIEILKDHIPWFSGIITKTPGYGTASTENRKYEVSGPWWYLENLVYQQTWNELIPINDHEDTLKPVNTGRVILGQDNSGSPISNGLQIQKILEYAIEQNAPILIGEIDPQVMFPYDETKDISCAEAIQRLLRWSPDAVVWFNYSTKPHPTLSIKSRNNINEANLYLKNNTCIKNLEITPRYDLQSPSVVVKYEKIHQLNGKSWTSIDVDSYPKNATGKEFKALVLTVELDGTKAHKIKQEVKTEPIAMENPEWWQKHLPTLQTIPPSQITIKSPTRKSNLPAELVTGSIAPWMGKNVEEDIIQAKISYETDSEHVIDRNVAIKLNATNATSKVYEQILTNEYAETSPLGLAEKLYTSINTLQFDGEIILESEEINTSHLMGSTLNIFDGLKTWETMRATIQSVKENIDCGRTIITFGPAKHLGPDDLVELLRANRKRQATQNATRRITGKPSKSTILEQSTHSKIENTDNGPTNFGKLVFVHPNDPSKKIIIDANAIKEDTFLKLYEEDYCHNGLLKKRMLLASEPYTPSKKGE